MTTNYVSTFIHVAEDCPVDGAEEPTSRGTAKGVAQLEFEMIGGHPYEYTSDDVLFTVHALRHDIPEEDRAAARTAFFAKSQACLRASPLAKRYGWGIHHDADARVALVPLGSERYATLAADPSLTQLKAMRSKRA